MSKYYTACFVKNPSRIDSILQPILVYNNHPFKIIKTVTLGKIDYENFINDLKADRRFIDKHKHKSCIDQGVWNCIFVHQKGYSDGILVMSDGNDYPKWTAYLPDIVHTCYKIG